MAIASGNTLREVLSRGEQSKLDDTDDRQFPPASASTWTINSWHRSHSSPGALSIGRDRDPGLFVAAAMGLHVPGSACSWSVQVPYLLVSATSYELHRLSPTY